MQPDPFIRSVGDLTFEPRGAVQPSPLDWRDVTLYEIMIDRFDDGHDRPPAPDGYPDRIGADPKSGVHPDADYQHFQGGTLRGIARRLDYIQGLGVTGLWLTPPYKQCAWSDDSYHGYSIQDFLRVDPRFGTTADLRALVDEAHRRGMYVILDVIFDHVGDVWAYAGKEGRTWKHGERFPFGYWRGGDGKPAPETPGPDDAVWPVEIQTPEAYFRMGAMRDTGTAHEREATHGDFHSSKALDMTHPAVVDTMIAVFKYWIAAVDVDGFRMDAYRHIVPEAGRRFCSAIREYAVSIGKMNFLLLGEVASDDRTIAPYAGSNSPSATEKDKTRQALLDALFDFPLHDRLGSVLRGEQGPDLLVRHWEFLNQYFRDRAQAGKHYVRFYENHDFGAGNHRRLLHGNRDPRLAVQAAAFVLMSQGIPCLYYGSEQGFDGGGDNDRYLRECMFGGKLGPFGTRDVHYFNPQHPIYRDVAALCRLRREEPVLRYGRQQFCRISDDGQSFIFPKARGRLMAFVRALDVRQVLVVLNLSDEPCTGSVELTAASWPAGRSVELAFGSADLHGPETLSADATAMRIRLPARSVVVVRPGDTRQAAGA